MKRSAAIGFPFFRAKKGFYFDYIRTRIPEYVENKKPKVFFFTYFQNIASKQKLPDDDFILLSHTFTSLLFVSQVIFEAASLSLAIRCHFGRPAEVRRLLGESRRLLIPITIIILIITPLNRFRIPHEARCMRPPIFKR